MGPAMLLVCALGLFLRGQAVLHFFALFRRDALMARVTRYQPVISRNLFFFARLFGGLRTEFERYQGTLPRVIMIVSNHQSLADIPALAVAFPTLAVRWVAKKSLGRGIPYISAALRLGRSALISRTGDYRAGQNELRRFSDLSREGISPVVFPEGTRSRTGRVRDFYTGAVRIILERNPLPVLSVAVDGGYRMSTIPKLITRIRGTRYRVRPLTLYPAPHGKREIVELVEKIHDEIGAQVKAWREEEQAAEAGRGQRPAR